MASPFGASGSLAVPQRAIDRGGSLQVLAAMPGLEGVSSHSGRRSLASELVRRGASTTAVQAAGGWRSATIPVGQELGCRSG